MAEHVWSVLCSRSVIDKETHQASLFDVVESLTVTLREPLPAKTKAVIPFRMNLVSFWTRSEGGKQEKTTCRVKIIAPNGEILSDTETTIDLSVHSRFRSTLTLEAFPLSGPGIFRFTVLLKDGTRWREVARIPVEIVLKEAFEAKAGGSKKKSRRTIRG